VDSATSREVKIVAPPIPEAARVSVCQSWAGGWPGRDPGFPGRSRTAV
jgi:hypothetical protein